MLAERKSGKAGRTGVARWLLLACVCRCLGAATKSDGDAHTYHADGRIVRTIRARDDGETEPELSVEGLERAAFQLLEVGAETHAARALAASARLRAAPFTCPAAFRRGRVWHLTWDPSRGRKSVRCRTRPHTPEWRGHGAYVNGGARDFMTGASSIETAVADYGLFHDAVTSYKSTGKIRLPEDIKYVVYTPSFHGEGWGNRVMALVALAALALRHGRVLLIDWTADWALEDYVALPFLVSSLKNFSSTHPHFASLPRAVVHDPAMMQPFPPIAVPVLYYSSYSAFWGALHRSADFAPLRHLCAQASDAAQRRTRRRIGEEEFRLLGCVTKAFLKPAASVSEAMAQQWGQLLPPLTAGAAALHAITHPYLPLPPPFPSPGRRESPDRAELVGAHIRLGPKHTSNYVVLPQSAVSAALHCIDEAMTPPNRVLFLATDTPALREEVRRRYGARAVFQDVPVAHTGEQHRLSGAPAVDENGRPRNETAVAGAMVDWWMLAQAPIAILSDKSSFGYSALARSLFGQSLPVTVGQTTRVGVCPRAVWEGHQCGGRSC